MLTKRPLLDTAADRQLFVRDASRERAENSAFQLSNTLIVGEPGSGKTSLLYDIRGNANERPREHPLAILVDARLADNPEMLIEFIVAEAQDNGWVAPGENKSGPDDPFALVTQVRRLREAPDNSMILLDDPDPEQAAILFGRLRDELWQLPAWFTAAVNPTVEAAALQHPPADAFFDHRIELAPFGRDDATEMLKRRITPGAAGKPIVVPEEPMQPRAVLVRADSSSSTGGRYDGELQHKLLTLSEATAGRTGVMVLTEIWNRGPVSASDSELQRSLDLSRARLTQVLTALERGGALRSLRDTGSGGMGRPRTLYDINQAP
jgi:hypothetical protein